jgi:AraC-like DNA-binding protein
MSRELLGKWLEHLTGSGIRFFDSGTRLQPDFGGHGFKMPYYEPQEHNHIEMIMLVSGGLALHVNGAWVHHRAGQPAVFLRNTYHSEHYLPDRQPYSLYWLTSMPSALTFHHTLYEPKTGYGQSAVRLSITSPFVGKLWDCGRAMPPDRPRFLYLLLQCLDYSLKNDNFSTDNYHVDVLGQVKEYIEEYYAEKITLEDLAAMAHYSAGHLNALFVELFGISIYQYLSKVRMHAAMKLLENGNMLVRDVAAAVGFQDQLYFSRYFRKFTGQTPAAFARNKLNGS